MNLIKTKRSISSFIAKFDIHTVNIGHKELIQFPNVENCSSDNEITELKENKILILTDHFDQLKTDMESRYQDLTKLQILYWILDLKYECEAKNIFKHSGYEIAWVKLIDIYPQVWGKTEPLLISFPSTYEVEKGFSSIIQLQE